MAARLKKRFGQHFLSDRSILRRIVEFARIGADDVVEIGPGAGALTNVLAQAARQVTAIEIDADWIADLRQSVPSNVQIIQGDALEIDFPSGRYHLVGNLPYNIATPLFKRFIDHRNRITDVTVMIQKEVAERLIAKPSTNDYGALSVLIQYYSNVTYGFTVPPGAFRPRPKVESAVVRLDWKPDIPEGHAFTDFVQQCFSSRRKKLANNLLAMFGNRGREDVVREIERAGIHANARPEELSVADFMRVYNRMSG